MKLHRNAKTTPHMRALLVHRIRQAQLAAARRRRRRASACGPPTNGCAGTGLGGGRRSRIASSRPHRQPRRTPPDDRQRHRRRAPRTSARPGRLPSGCRCRAPRSPPSCAASVSIAWRALEPAAPVHRYERTRPASSCTSISSRWGAFSASVIVFIRHRRTASGLAGNTSTSPSTITAAPLMSKSCRINRRDDRGFLRRTIGWFARRGVVVAARPHRQRQCLQQPLLSARRRAAPASGSAARGPIGRKPTARPNGLSRR